MFEVVSTPVNKHRGSDGKESACTAGKLGLSPAGEDALEERMAAHCSLPAWRTPWTEEPGGQQSMGSRESDTTEQLGRHTKTARCDRICQKQTKLKTNFCFSEKH